MKFEEAFPLLRERKKIIRGKQIVYINKEGIPCYKIIGGVDYDRVLVISREDFTGDDWEEFKEEDDWSWLKFRYSGRDNRELVKTLKAKILEDVKKTKSRCPDCMRTGCGKCIPPETFEAIVERRFGI